MIARTIIGSAIVSAGLTLGFAAAASADIDETPPPPTTTDVSSGGMIGDANMGASWGTPVGASNGYALWAGPYRIESSGFPVSRFASNGPGYTSETTTNYNYEGGVEQWSKYDSDFYTNREYRAVTPAEGFKSQQNVRWGSMSYKCVDGVCTMVPTA